MAGPNAPDGWSDVDDLSRFEAKETSHEIPLGWALLFWGLVAWGLYYLWAYTPGLGGWSQARELDGEGTSSGANLLATVAFTAIPTAAAIALALAQRRRKRGSA
jgi:hypothetical protein